MRPRQKIKNLRMVRDRFAATAATTVLRLQGIRAGGISDQTLGFRVLFLQRGGLGCTRQKIKDLRMARDRFAATATTTVLRLRGTRAGGILDAPKTKPRKNANYEKRFALFIRDHTALPTPV